MTTIKYSSTPAINRRWRLIPIASILCLAAILYFYQLGTESLWIDEIYSVSDAQNFNPTSSRPLYFLLLGWWMQFGTGDTWLRVLAVLFGLGSIGLTYLLGRRLVGETTGLIAAFVLTLSPLFINHAQEVRMYTLSTFLGLGGTLALTYALEHLRAFSLCVWAIARVLAILTTPLNVVLLLPDIVVFGVQFRHRRRAWLALGGGLLLIGILWLPVAFHLATSAGPAYMSGWAEARSKPDFADVLIHPFRTFTVFSDNFKLEPLKSFFSPALIYFYHFYSAILLGLLAIALWSCRSARLLWVAAWALLPTAAILFISYASNTIWLPRYLLMVVPYLLILLAAGFLRVWQGQRRVALVIASVYLIAVSGGLLHYYTTSDREDWRSVGQTITAVEQPGDAIAVSSTNSRPLLAITHYYHGTAPVELLGDFSIVRREQREQELAERLHQTLSTSDSRLWLVVKLGNSDNRQQITQIVQHEAGQSFSVQTYESIEQPVNLFLIAPRQDSR